MAISPADRDAAFIQGTLQPIEAENLLAKRPRRGPQQNAQRPRRKRLRRERNVAIKSRDLAGLQEKGFDVALERSSQRLRNPVRNHNNELMLHSQA